MMRSRSAFVMAVPEGKQRTPLMRMPNSLPPDVLETCFGALIALFVPLPESNLPKIALGENR
jgi:hypothetical protein